MMSINEKGKVTVTMLPSAVKVIGKWMSEVWGTEDKYRAFITLQTLLIALINKKLSN